MMKRYTAIFLAMAILLGFTACRANTASMEGAEPLTSTEERTTAMTAEPSVSGTVTAEVTVLTTGRERTSVVTTTAPTTAQMARTAAPTPTANSVVSKASEPTTKEQTTKAKTTTAKPTTTVPSTAFNVEYYIEYARDYALQIGMKLDKGTMGTWDTPLAAGPTLKYTERDIKSSMDWYKKDGYTAVWVWAEKRSNSDKYDVYISRGGRQN